MIHSKIKSALICFCLVSLFSLDVLANSGTTVKTKCIQALKRVKVAVTNMGTVYEIFTEEGVKPYKVKSYEDFETLETARKIEKLAIEERMSPIRYVLTKTHGDTFKESLEALLTFNAKVPGWLRPARDIQPMTYVITETFGDDFRIKFEALVKSGVKIPEDAMEYLLQKEYDGNEEFNASKDLRVKFKALIKKGVEIPKRLLTGEKLEEYIEHLKNKIDNPQDFGRSNWSLSQEKLLLLKEAGVNIKGTDAA